MFSFARDSPSQLVESLGARVGHWFSSHLVQPFWAHLCNSALLKGIIFTRELQRPLSNDLCLVRFPGPEVASGVSLPSFRNAAAVAAYV